MIKNKIIMIFTIIVLIPPCLSHSTETDWQTFLNLKQQYYYLDKQPFEEIVCNIEVPLISDLMARMKQQLAPLQDKVEIRENLSAFSLTFSPAEGLRFSEPEFDVILKSSEGVTDPEKLNQGITMMKTGFSQQVEGVKNILTGIFDDYVYPTPERYQDLAVTRNDEGFAVTYIFEKNQVTDNYLGNTIQTSQTGSNVEVTAIQTYSETSGNKLLLKNGSAHIAQPMGTIQSNFEIQYQKIKHIVFPKTISTRSELTMNGISQKGVVDIFLTGCRIR